MDSLVNYINNILGKLKPKNNNSNMNSKINIKKINVRNEEMRKNAVRNNQDILNTVEDRAVRENNMRMNMGATSMTQEEMKKHHNNKQKMLKNMEKKHLKNENQDEVVTNPMYKVMKAQRAKNNNLFKGKNMPGEDLTEEDLKEFNRNNVGLQYIYDRRCK